MKTFQYGSLFKSRPFKSGNEFFDLVLNGEVHKETAAYNDKCFDEIADIERGGSGIYLPLVLTVKDANDFITILGENARRIYQEDVMNFYNNLSSEDKEKFLQKDRAEALIKHYEPVNNHNVSSI